MISLLKAIWYIDLFVCRKEDMHIFADMQKKKSSTEGFCVLEGKLKKKVCSYNYRANFNIYCTFSVTGPGSSKYLSLETKPR